MDRLLAYGMMMVFVTADVGFASHEGGVAPSSVEFKMGKLGIEVAAESDDDGRLKSLVVTSMGKTITVPTDELTGDVKDVDLGSLQFLVRFGAPGAKLDESHREAFAISFACGEVAVNSDKSTEFHSRDVIRFEFYKGTYDRRLRCVSEGDDKFSWRVLQKNIGKAEIQIGSKKGATNPLSSDD